MNPNDNTDSSKPVDPLAPFKKQKEATDQLKQQYQHHGWVCPKCGKVWAPWVDSCHCGQCNTQYPLYPPHPLYPPFWPPYYDPSKIMY